MKRLLPSSCSAIAAILAHTCAGDAQDFARASQDTRPRDRGSDDSHRGDLKRGRGDFVRLAVEVDNVAIIMPRPLEWKRH